ncbi:MAG: hypothetical protein ACYSX1_13175 [Planctomycetota bacterium]
MAGELVLERGGAGDLARAARKEGIMRISFRIIHLTMVFVVSFLVNLRRNSQWQ